MADPTEALAAELDDFLAEPFPSSQPVDEAEGYPDVEPRDEQQVDRMLRRRRRLLDERGRLTEVASAEIQRIREWERDRTAGIDEQTVWLDRGLEGFMRQHHDATGRKSLPLPSGTLKITQPGAPSVLVLDESEFVTWALLDDERDRFLRRTVAPEKQELRASLQMGPEDDDRDDGAPERWWFAVDADGEVVPGIRLTKPAQARFSVSQAKAEPFTVTPPEHDVRDTRTEENAE